MTTLNCIIEWKEWISIGLGFLGTFFWLFIIYFIKPSLTIGKVEFDSKLNVEVINNGCFDATNIKIEACTVRNDTTIHFKLDMDDFLIIPRKKSSTGTNTPHIRLFKSGELESWSKEYSNFEVEKKLLLEGTSILRIRIHACHSFTGFGRLHESKFQYQNGKFVHLKV